MINHDSLVATLKMALESEYYKQGIPSDIDTKIYEIISFLLSCDKNQLEVVIDDITGDNASVLGLFAERMASLAVRENSIEPVKQGLLALLIYAQTEDLREILLILSLLHDATIKTGNDPKKIFDEIRSVIGGAEFLNNYLNQPDEDKSIDAMGYEESKDEDGFLYVRTW